MGGDLLVSVYDWIVEAIKGIISDIKKGVNFVDDFSQIIGDFFDDMRGDLIEFVEWIFD
jgi:hypothetical protein